MLMEGSITAQIRKIEMLVVCSVLFLMKTVKLGTTRNDSVDLTWMVVVRDLEDIVPFGIAME